MNDVHNLTGIKTIATHDHKFMCRDGWKKVEDFNEFSRGKLFFPPKKDLLIIFPSWLEHDVPVNTSEFDRLSLSFNIMCRGEYGMKNSRQEVIL